MSKQDFSIERNEVQNKVIDLEKKYFKLIEDIIFSEDFKKDLLAIEKYIQENYCEIKNIWKVKNKLKIPAERLVRHHFYTKLSEKIIGIYPSPISSDMGIIMEDCVLCIDIKTIDTKSNDFDISVTTAEPNQISFSNEKCLGVEVVTNLEAKMVTEIDGQSLEKHVLTYVIKIIYVDDKKSFRLSREEFPTLVLVCIPNGVLSNLFKLNIVRGFKTYKYYTVDDNYELAKHFIPAKYKSNEEKAQYVHDHCINKGFVPKTIKTKRGLKQIFVDNEHEVVWCQTTENYKPMIAAIKSGQTLRLENEFLKERYDSKDQEWKGYVEKTIEEKA